MPDTVTVGMMKVVPVKWEPEENLATLERLIPEIAAAGAEIIITPEAFLDGYVIHQEDWTPERMAAVCEPGPDGPRARRIRQMAAEAQVHLVAGLSEQRGEEFYNTCHLIGPGGEIVGSHDKLQVNPRYTYGKRIEVFDTPWCPVGMMICADRRWPEIARTLRIKGARIILMPTYGMKGERNAMWMQTRSYENAVWICFTHPEESLITDPKGEIAAQLVDESEYLIHTCYLMIEGATEMLADRHPDVYGFAWERDET